MLSITRLIQEQKLFNKSTDDAECFDDPQLDGPHDGTGPGKGPGKGKGPNAKHQEELDSSNGEAEKKTDNKGKILIGGES